MLLQARDAISEAAALARRRGQMRRHPAPTFVFADLVGYTGFADAAGDAAAADLAREFRRRMCAISRRHGAWQVKSMGDGVMIWSPDAAAAIDLAADAVAEVGRDLAPVRVGVHTGAAEMRGCDWYGRTVNLAARLADGAPPNGALASDATARAARSHRCRERLELPVRGIAGPVGAWRLG